MKSCTIPAVDQKKYIILSNCTKLVYWDFFLNQKQFPNVQQHIILLILIPTSTSQYHVVFWMA